MRSVWIGMPAAEIDTPALCLDIEAVQANITRMADFARQAGVRLRPHAKTHKCPMLAHMQLAAGAIGITCAKVGEAEALVAGGIRDILIANEVIGTAKIARLVNLAAHSEVMVAVDDAANVADLDAAARAKGICLRVVIEVDIGMQFEGLPEGCGPHESDRIYTVTDVTDDVVVLDGNHPLAGIAVRFSLTLHSIRDASDDEMQASSVSLDDEALRVLSPVPAPPRMQ